MFELTYLQNTVLALYAKLSDHDCITEFVGHTKLVLIFIWNAPRNNNDQ